MLPPSVAVGTAITVTATFKDANGILTDPTTVVCKAEDPLKAVTNPTTTQVSTGVYSASFIINSPGEWNVRFEGTGALTAAEEARILGRTNF